MTHASHHEPGTAHQEIESSSDRSFGVTLGGALALLAAYWAWRGNDWWLYALAFALPLLCLALARPGLLAPLNKAWTKLGLVIGAIVAPVVMGLIYFGVITPLAILARLVGKDFLRLESDASAPSYWLAREQREPSAESLRDQF